MGSSSLCTSRLPQFSKTFSLTSNLQVPIKCRRPFINIFNYSYIHKMFILISLIKIKFRMGNLLFYLFHKYSLVAMLVALCTCVPGNSSATSNCSSLLWVQFISSDMADCVQDIWLFVYFKLWIISNNAASSLSIRGWRAWRLRQSL